MSYISNNKKINGIYQNSGWTPNSNTTAYWKLSQDWLDYSGNNNHLLGGDPGTCTDLNSTLNMTAPTKFDTGKFGNSVVFNSSLHNMLYHSGTTALVSKTQDFTLSTWIYYTGVAPYGTYIFSLDGWHNHGWEVSTFGESESYNIGQGLMEWTQDQIAGCNTGYRSDFSLNTWMNVTLTYDSNTYTTTIYMNGISGDTQRVQLPMDITQPILTLGAAPIYQGTSNASLSGRMCEVILESVCWAESDVLNYYNRFI